MFDGDNTNLTTFLETLSSEKLAGLYTNQWTCQAVFRSLPGVAKQYVLRFLFVDTPIKQYIVDSWIQAEFASTHNVAIDTLTRLQLLQAVAEQGGDVSYKMHATFQTNLRLAVCGGGSMHAAVPKQVLSHMPSRATLDEFAQEQWEMLLLYLVGNKSSPPSPSKHLGKSALPVVDLFAGAGLLNRSSKGGHGNISELGFRFLLMDVSSQLWHLIAQYVKDAEVTMGVGISEVVSFLLELAFRPVTHPGAISELSPVQYKIAAHMTQLAVMTTFKVGNAIWYVPTSLAACLCSSSQSDIQIGQSGGQIVVETNYRLYCYTISPIQRAILELFTRCECTLPNLYVGAVTRDSIAHALQCGITAEQIVAYLMNHAHPKIRTRVPVVPEVVSDQIRLWEKDINRLRCVDSFLYDEFPSHDVFKKAVSFSRRIGVYLWDDGKSKVLAKLEGHGRMRDYIKSIKGGG